MFFQFEVWPLSTTLWNILVKTLFIKIKSGQHIPYDLSLYNKPSGHTLPTALDISKNTPLVYNEG